MCTLTMVPLGTTQFRLAFNRDESRLRPAALVPQRRRFGGRTAILPIDLPSKGTWIAVNDAGLVLALLNHTPPISGAAARGSPLNHGRHSRGAIIPSLLACATLDAALAQVAELPVANYPRFRLVLLGDGEVAEVLSDGERLWRKRRVPVTGPLLWTSSSLGDHLVERLRRERFIQQAAQPGGWAARQDAFHRHRWPEEPHLSVCMSRADACTVSYTIVELEQSAALMTYYPAAPDVFAAPAMARILFEQVSVR